MMNLRDASSSNMSGGLPASWFTSHPRVRNGGGVNDRERINQESRERVSRISRNETALRDAFRFREERISGIESQRGLGLEQDGRLDGFPNAVPYSDVRDAHPVAGDEDIEMRDEDEEGENEEEEDSDAILVREFEYKIHKKLNECVKVIENRRDLLLYSFESDNAVLQQIQQNPQNVTDWDFHSSVSRLQRIRLRAIEMETLQLQRAKSFFRTKMAEFYRAVHKFAAAKNRGEHPINPVTFFQSVLTEIDPYQMTGMKMVLASKNDTPMVSELPNSGNSPIASFHNAFPQHQKGFPLRSLPPEILSMVLDRVSQKSEIAKYLTVSKVWAEIIVKLLYYRPHINKKHQLDLFMKTMAKPGYMTVFDYRAMIKRLNFSFVGDYMTDEQLFHFVGCPNLERLTLVFCKHITSSSISAVLTGCKFLQSVDITGIKEVSDSIFNTLALQCRRVQGFYVPQARDVSLEALQTFVTHAPLLKRVKITANFNLNDELVTLLADLCPLLVEVDITLSPNVHDESLVKLFCQLTQLREFRITHNSAITDKFLKEVSQKVSSLPALRLIDLCDCENVTDKSVELLVALAPKLRNVFLGKCSRITDNSLLYLTHLGKNLQTVHFGHCFNVTDNGVRLLIQSCPRIQYVDFACCTNLTNRTLYALADLTKLKRIGLVKCSQMTDEGLLNMVALRGRSDTLERVHLSYCSNLTIYPIYELLMACPKLSHLSLTAVPSFLRSDITAFCRAAPSDFSENQKQIFCVFSGKGVHKLRHYLMGLTAPTSGPQSNVREVLTNFIVTKNLLHEGEEIESGVQRVGNEINNETPAILAATHSLTPLNALNNNDFAFQNINFERLDQVFSSLRRVQQDRNLTEQDVDRLFSLVDEDFCEDPDSEQFGGADGCVAPEASDDLNAELAQMIRKFHELQERICDFEVNVASMVRVQFQFAGALLNEMTHIYFQMVDLNRCISQIQDRVYDVGIERDVKGLTVWRMMWLEKFEQVMEKYKLTTIVLRLYLRDNVAALTRQREIFLARQRAALAIPPGDQDVDSHHEGEAWNAMGDRVSLWQRFELRNDLRMIQFGLRGDPAITADLPVAPNFVPEASEEPSTTTPDDDESLENA